eukprot:6175003-Pleurochrysis_carterae.AAC.1
MQAEADHFFRTHEKNRETQGTKHRCLLRASSACMQSHACVRCARAHSCAGVPAGMREIMDEQASVFHVCTRVSTEGGDMYLS